LDLETSKHLVQHKTPPTLCVNATLVKNGTGPTTMLMERMRKQQRSKAKPIQEATKAMKQYFEQYKKSNKVRETKKIYKPLVKKKESLNELTMAQTQNEARRRRKEHEVQMRAGTEQTRSAKKRKKV